MITNDKTADLLHITGPEYRDYDTFFRHNLTDKDYDSFVNEYNKSIGITRDIISKYNSIISGVDISNYRNKEGRTPKTNAERIAYREKRSADRLFRTIKNGEIMTPTIQLLLQVKEYLDEFFDEISPDLVNREDTVNKARECLIEARRLINRNTNEVDED